MADFIDQLLNRHDVVHGDPPPPSVIDVLAARFEARLPESLLRIWGAGNLVLDSVDAHIPGPTEVLKLIEDGAWSGELLARGLVPVLDDHQSNYVAVILRAPLAYRVAHLPHDDGSRLLYRDLNGFTEALLHMLDAGAYPDMFFFETKGDYAPDAPRPQSDQDAARALMATDGANEEWNYAAQLLDACNLREWTKLLETDHFVRRDVVARMRQMQSPAIQELLKRDQVAVEVFAQDVAEAARQAGLKVGERRNDVLLVGGKWMSLEAFFHRRNIPNAMPRMIAWFEDLIAGRNPHDRTGHFMSD